MRLGLKSILIIFVILGACGYTVDNRTNYQIIELKTDGDKKINYLIKNKLLQGSDKLASKTLKLEINSKKIRSVKEKNISNQIVKYEITIITIVKVLLQNNHTETFTINKKSFYDVRERHSETLNNEKKIIGILVKDISEKISENIEYILNDI